MRRLGGTLALAAVLAAPLAAQQSRPAATTPVPAPPPAPPEPPNEFQYVYGSAEAAGISRQAFRALLGYALDLKAGHDAGKPLVQRVLAQGSTLARPLFESCGDKPLAAVFDIDETLLLNTGFEYWDVTRPDRTQPWPEGIWESWEKSGFDKVAPVPGSLETVTALRNAGIAVVFNSNRNASTAEDTAKALAFAGFGSATPDYDLFTDAVGDSKKDGRRARIADTYCVIALVGDQLGDFSDLFNASIPAKARRDAANEPAIAQLWGQGWFVLPNPVYGQGTRGSIDEVFPAALRWSPPRPPEPEIEETAE